MRGILEFFLTGCLILQYCLICNSFRCRGWNVNGKLSEALRAKGFGFREDDPLSSKPLFRNQLLHPCLCSSGIIYRDCCFQLHSGSISSELITPEKTVRARFSAYSGGFGEYLLSTLHPTSEAWTQETNQASQLFDFRYFRIVSVNDPTDTEKLFQKTPENIEYSVVRFHYITVEKKTLQPSPVDEISLLFKDTLPPFVDFVDPYYAKSKFPAEKLSTKWYFSRSVYQPIEEKERQRLYENLGIKH